MMRRNTVIALSAALCTLLASQTASARGIRVDAGAWNTVFSGDSTTTNSASVAIGFDMSIFGVTGNSATVTADGSVILGGGAETARFDVFHDVNQTQGGNVVDFSIEATNALFADLGVNSGLRFSWTATETTGAQNIFQLSMFELASGIFALEFNYDQLTFGDDGSHIGYSTSLGIDFDLPGSLGLLFDDYAGIGDIDPSMPALCPGTPSALACNNYYGDTGAFDPSNAILPGFLDGFFRDLSSTDPTAVQGRYLFLSESVAVPEPSMVALLAAGWIGVVLVRRRRA